MADTKADQPEPKVYPLELKELLDRGMAGDASVLPEVKKAFDEFPELEEAYADLAGNTEKVMLDLVAGKAVPAREAIRRKTATMRSELYATTHSPLEKLLVDRVVATWILTQHSDCALAHRLAHCRDADPGVRAVQQRADAAQRRHLAAIKALALAQKLLKPALSPADVLANLSTESRPAGRRAPFGDQKMATTAKSSAVPRNAAGTEERHPGDVLAQMRAERAPKARRREEALPAVEEVALMN